MQKNTEEKRRREAENKDDDNDVTEISTYKGVFVSVRTLKTFYTGIHIRSKYLLFWGRHRDQIPLRP